MLNQNHDERKKGVRLPSQSGLQSLLLHKCAVSSANIMILPIFTLLLALIDMKRLYILLVILITLSGCKANKENLRILFWNIQNGMWDGQTDNYDRFVNWVSEQDADVCVWCESVSLYKNNSTEPLDKAERYLPDGWKELAARYGHKYLFVGGHRDDYPQVITSKYPITEVSKIIGNQKDSIVTHGAGWAQIDVADKTFNLVTLHTWPQKWGFNIPKEMRDESRAANEGDKYRLMEMTYICEHTILTDPNAGEGYWIMLGDFNARSRVDNEIYKYPEEDTRFYVHDYIKANTPYIDIIHERYPEEFFTTTGGKSRIDFVYCTKPVYDKIVNAQVISDEYTTPVRNPQKLSNFWHPSDHRPIIVDLEIK